MIATSSVTMSFGQNTLFKDVSVKFRPGNRYGLIGANGVGKSTFMKIMTGEVVATKGQIAIDSGCTLGYLKQDHYEYENTVILDVVFMGNPALWRIHQEREHLYSHEALTEKEEERAAHIEEEFGNAGGYTMEAEAAKLLIGLGIDESFHSRPLSALTGGFKLRVLLAQCLFGKPDILLLDEPTNHLDMASREWLVGFLAANKGTVVVISHDRHFLNSVCTHIADLDYCEVRLFTGNYDDFMIANEEALERIRNDNSKKEKRVAELREFISRFGANASKARQATSRQNELRRIQLEEIKPSSRQSPYIRFKPKQRLGDKVIELEGISKSYDSLLFRDFSATIENDEKVAILGTNGVGKTTLLRILLNELQPDRGKVRFGDTVDFSHFPQDAGSQLKGREPAMEWLRCSVEQRDLTDPELRSFMGKMLFSGDDVNKKIDVLSGGEKARLILARMMMQGGNVIALDEPTNHLDLESIESLNYALTLVQNTVLFVSHDYEFVRSLATRIFYIDDQKILDFRGGLEDFESYRRKARRKQPS